MSDQKVRQERIRFYPEQLKYLEAMYPEVVPSAHATQAEIHQQAGMRKVVLKIKELVQA